MNTEQTSENILTSINILTSMGHFMGHFISNFMTKIHHSLLVLGFGTMISSDCRLCMLIKLITKLSLQKTRKIP